ncbi:MAG TPA: hypothetical protein VFR87_07165 [Nocardioidaceae bacterium]|nr:hypothetical protein [Nocardioidaceae bacterium]
MRHAHALVVEVPGWWRTRAAVERAVLDRGWNLAFAPADADVLVVCGEPGQRLAGAFEQVWHQMPGPRVRVDARAYDDVATCLDEAYRVLLDTEHHRDDARHRFGAPDLLNEADKGEDHGGGHEGMDHGGGHEGMDHGDMDMAPGGIPLAEGGEDRDGLEMDVLHVRLGPVLPHWPAGLVLRCALQGDVVTEAQAEFLDGEQPGEDVPAPLARRLDNIASLLALAGWDDAAAEARRIRDIALRGDGEPTAGQVERLRRKVRRSRTLRWSLRGIRPLTEDEVHDLGLPADAVGDTYDRLTGMLDRASAGDGPAPTGDAAEHTHDADRALSPDRLARLFAGLDLATARLVVASVDLHGLRAGHAEHKMSHG